MGGRGASSGRSENSNKYGSQYHTVLQDGNIKFVTKNFRNAESLMETMTDGRVYVTVGGKDLLQIIYFDTASKRNRTIDLSHPHKGKKPHVHHGYEHNEIDIKNGVKGGATGLSIKERKMVDKVTKLWYNHINK